MKKKKLLIPRIIIVLVIVSAFLFNSLEFLDLRVSDFLFQKRKPVNNDVIVVGIDDESLMYYGKWPWNRNVMARAVNELSKGEPAVIGVDIIYAERSEDEFEDRSLIEAVKNTENIIIPGYCLFYEEGENGIEVDHVVEPFAELREHSDFALLNVIPDNDGILRKAFLSIREGEKQYEGFSYAVYRKYCEKMGMEAVPVSEIPKDSYNRLWIDYRVGPSAFKMARNQYMEEGFEHISISSVVNKDIPPEYFYGKIVLIGVTSMGVPDDYYFTSIAPESPMYGIEVHANVISQLLAKDFYSYVPNLVQVILLLVIGAFLVLGDRFFKPGYYSLFVVALSSVFAISTNILFKNGIILNVVYYAFLIGIEYLFSLFHRLIVVTRDRMRIQNMFGRYMEAKLVQQLVDADIEELTLGGQTLRVTILFVDIRGFTTLSEGLRPDIVVGILNIFLEMCSTAILRYEGTLDKYIGDCAMAIYNAPVATEYHELAAIKTALEMVEKTDEINERLYEKFGVRIEYGVGINTGMAVVGNIGSDFRMDYTAVGDTVNTASRLQGKSEGRQILISEEVYLAVKDEVEAEPVGDMSVKGKHDLIKAYSVLGLKEEKSLCEEHTDQD